MAVLLVSSSALVLATVTLVLVLGLRRSCIRLQEQMTDLAGKVDALGSGNSGAATQQRFSAQLKVAEQTQDTVQSKPMAQADKYRYAVALAAQGYTPQGIADALQMSRTEVEQIMQLSLASQSSRGKQG